MNLPNVRPVLPNVQPLLMPCSDDRNETQHRVETTTSSDTANVADYEAELHQLIEHRVVTPASSDTNTVDHEAGNDELTASLLLSLHGNFP